MMQTISIFEAMKFFRDKVSANHSGVTLYHGMDDILSGYIPQYLQDNTSETEMKWLRGMGFEEKRD